MLNELHDCLDREGTSRKRRSQWIENAIERLVLTEDFEVIVMEEFLEEGDNLTIPLTLNASLKSMLMNVIESSESRIETSSIVRAAISQRIMHHGGRDERRSA